MKALILESPGVIELREVDNPKLNSGQALVSLKAAALNKRDQWILQEKYPGIHYPNVLGSDGAGVVVQVAGDVDGSWVGKEVVINPNIDWGDNPRVQSREYNILGMPAPGTFTESIAVNIDRLANKPAHLDFTEAAALPLAGLTAFRAVFTQGKVDTNKSVLISGFGGGVAQFAFQFSNASGAATSITSGSDNKITKALEMGAKQGFNYNNDDWINNAKSFGGFDVIIDSAGGDQINSLLKLLKPNGKLVFYGATNGLPSNIDLYSMFWKQLALRGSTMGSDEEFDQMLKFVELHQINPLISEVFSIDDYQLAFEEQRQRENIGKVVLTL